MAYPNPSQLGLCSWSLQPESISDLIGKAARAGVTGVQLALEPLISNPDAWSDVSSRLVDMGFSLFSGMFEPIGEDYTTPLTIRETGGFVPDSTWEGNLRRMELAARIAADLALKIISFHAGFIPEDSTTAAHTTLVDRVRKIADCFLDACGGMLLLETGQETADTLMTFLDAVDRPNVIVNFDPANMLLYDMEDPIPALRQLAPRVRQVHIKDANRPTRAGAWGEEVAVGTGEVDWPAFLGILADSHFTGPLVVEREAGEDRLGDIRTAVEFITKNLKEMQ